MRDEQIHYAFARAALTLCGLEIRYHNDPSGHTWWLTTTQVPSEVNCPACQDEMPEGRP
jgi:hypothetical protein